jgi:hypothetical protein
MGLHVTVYKIQYLPHRKLIPSPLKEQVNVVYGKITVHSEKDAKH